MAEYSPLRPAEGVTTVNDAGPAAWLARSLLRRDGTQGTVVGSVIPTGFEAYARIFHPAYAKEGNTGPVRWREVAARAGRVVHPEMQWEAVSRPVAANAEPGPWSRDPEIGRCPPDVLVPLAELLSRHTSTPNHCWFCVWDGYAGIRDAFPTAPLVRLPDRSYVLLQAPVDVIARGALTGCGGWAPGPNLWWPEDRAWCVATEVDFRWTYAAGTASCINGVLADPRLEALETRLDHRGDYASDTVNGPVARI